MKLHRLIASLVVAVTLSALAAQTVSAKEKWINLTTKNFNIISNAGEDDTRELAQKLEQFRFVFSQIFNTKAADSVPVTVMVFKSDEAFKPFKPLYNGKPSNVAGYFQQGKDENLIALNVSANATRPMSVIFHEYTHLLTSFSVRDWPGWLKEGMAELYSTFEVKKNVVTLGVPVSNHVFLLRENKFLPLERLFAVTRNSPEYNERQKRGIFYAESWALAHYLMFGDKSARQPQLNKFIELITSGATAEKAFAEAFKTDFASMEKELRNYVGRNVYSGMTYTFKSAIQAESEINVRPLPDAEVQFYLGNLLFRTRRADEAEKYFTEAAALDPDLARPYEGLGFLAIERQKYDEAGEHFKQAVARGSKNHLAHYYYAEALQREALQRQDNRQSLTPETVRTIVDELKTSIKLMPNFAYSYQLLGFIRLVTGENLEEGAQMMKQAMRLAPQNTHFALTLAQIQVRMQDYAGAKKTLEPLLASEDDSAVKTSAASMMRMIDAYARPAVEPSATSRDSEPRESLDRPRLKRRDGDGQDVPPAEISRIDPNARPTLRKTGVEVMGGVLSAIECEHGGMVLVLKQPGKLLRFTVSDITGLEFYSQDQSAELRIGCGPINKQAFVYFKPLTGQSAFSGDAVAVEFIK